MKNLDKRHPDRIKGKETMKNNFCHRRNTKPRKVNCCSLTRDTLRNEYPLRQQDIQFNRTEPSDKIGCSRSDSNYESGCWKPLGPKNQCGIRLSFEFIVGGNYSKLGEFPYMALLGYQIDGKILYTCGGSIINSKYVLTAAHCHSRRQPVK